MRRWGILILVCLIGGAILWMPWDDGSVSEAAKPMNGTAAKVMDLSSFAAEKPSKSLRLLFIHHSCGGQLLSEPGADSGENCIYVSHPNGGGLRRLLEMEGYEVFEASYKSAVGDKTDVFDWLPKFRDTMDRVLACARQDAVHPPGTRNDVVVFKSCYPNNLFVGEGTPPGNPAGPELTLTNAKASYAALLSAFERHPEVLFVCVTAPPNALGLEPERLWKVVLRKVLGKSREDVVERKKSAALARSFADWMKSPDGWLRDYKGRNVVVFDYYGTLTEKDGRQSDLSLYPTRGGMDSHPSSEGNARAARAFVPFLNRAVRRAELVK